MNDFNNFQQNQSSNSKAGIDKYMTKVLIPLGSFIVGVVGLLVSIDKLPVWAIWIVVICLGIVLIKILARPIRNFKLKVINRYRTNRFAKRMRPDLVRFTKELNEMLDSQRTTTIPYFITHIFSKLSNEVHLLNCLHKNQQQFTILQSWTTSFSDNLKYHRHAEFLQDAAQFSSIVSSFTWACEWVREGLGKTEVREKMPKDVVSDWNAVIGRISDFTSRVKRFMKAVNEKYNTSPCRDYFQDIKQL